MVTSSAKMTAGWLSRPQSQRWCDDAINKVSGGASPETIATQLSSGVQSRAKSLLVIGGVCGALAIPSATPGHHAVVACLFCTGWSSCWRWSAGHLLNLPGAALPACWGSSRSHVAFSVCQGSYVVKAIHSGFLGCMQLQAALFLGV